MKKPPDGEKGHKMRNNKLFYFLQRKKTPTKSVQTLNVQLNIGASAKKALLVSTFIIVFTFIILLKLYNSIPNIQMEKRTFADKNLVSVEIPDCTLYLDKRLNYYDSIYLTEDLDWLYKCKLYKDFGWYPNAYLVYTSIDFIRRGDRKGFTTNAYFKTTEKNDDKYIFIWNATDSSIIHELAHFADNTHNRISHDIEWYEIYQAEWKDNEWLKAYKKESLDETQQLERYLQESFAEGFSQWYCRYYTDNYIKEHSDKSNDDLILHTVNPQAIDVDEDTYPLTFSYMQNFYENYEFNDVFYENVKLGYTSIE